MLSGSCYAWHSYEIRGRNWVTSCSVIVKNGRKANGSALRQMALFPNHAIVLFERQRVTGGIRAQTPGNVSVSFATMCFAALISRPTKHMPEYFAFYASARTG